MTVRHVAVPRSPSGFAPRPVSRKINLIHLFLWDFKAVWVCPRGQILNLPFWFLIFSYGFPMFSYSFNYGLVRNTKVPPDIQNPVRPS